MHKLNSFRQRGSQRQLFNTTVQLSTTRTGQHVSLYKLKSCRDLIEGKVIKDYETKELVFN
jgi:hypothetical protein